MRDEALKRLTTLRKDYEDGTAQLVQIEQQAAGMRETLLRIAGAIQILEELLAQERDQATGTDGEKLTVG
jgi:hypothetical protein